MLQRAADAARSYRRSKGSYTGLDAPGALHAIDSALAARQPTSAEQAAAPGPAADPSLIAVYVMNPDIVELCNTSQADHSYCILTQYGRSWTYGTAAGSIYAAAGALNNGASTTW
jgi:hypothetical protein